MEVTVADDIDDGIQSPIEVRGPRERVDPERTIASDEAEVYTSTSA